MPSSCAGLVDFSAGQAGFHCHFPDSWGIRRVIVGQLVAGARYKAPTKRSQHTNVTLLGTTCCMRLATVLRCVATCWLKFENGQI